MENASLYDISLRIAYAYPNPAGASRALLRMLPLNRPGQQLVTGYVGVDPAPNFRRDGVDFFGNPTVLVAHDGQIDELVFSFDGRARRSAEERIFDLSCDLSRIGEDMAMARSLAPESPHHFTGPSPRVPADAEIAGFARDLIAPGMSASAAVETLSHALHAEIAFDPEATEVTTSPAEAFRQRRGVCQDISHVLISALRAVGLPAGYVSGFLRTIPPEGEARLEGADAMHAWVRAWCGAEIGWVEIDPTNDMWVGADHVAVALGRDYADVAPVKGSIRSVGAHETRQSVDVRPV
ncbi:MAG: transglutaminase domain-containing protein [Pikeienuella sp.]